ncbi:MAG: DUF2294 family protein [Anaerolineales bacterium]|nr:DUF2294 family protein [Anaerolineales bacterium]
MLNQQQAYGDLIKALQSFCREDLGREPRRIRVDLDNNMALILLEQFLFPSEIEADQQGTEGEETYEEWLRDMFKPRLQLIVEETTRQQVTLSQIYIDFPVGNIIGVFVFAENLKRRGA